MSLKPVILGKRASQDVDDAIAYYLNENAAPAALGFVDALQDAYALGAAPLPLHDSLSRR